MTVDELLMLAAAVRRGLRTPLLVGDLPFGSYEASDEQAIAHRAPLRQGGGLRRGQARGRRHGRARPRHRRAGVPVMGHVGLTPQTATALGGYRAQGRTAERAPRQVLEDALALQEAGCFAIVFEAIPADVTDVIMPHMEIPVIGIGAGAEHGRPGARLPRPARHPRRLHGRSSSSATPTSARRWCAASRPTPRTCARARFPGPEHTYGIAPEELERLRAQLRRRARPA